MVGSGAVGAAATVVAGVVGTGVVKEYLLKHSSDWTEAVIVPHHAAEPFFWSISPQSLNEFFV